MRGRKPQPTALKIISQSQHLRPDVEDEPLPPGELLEPPVTMTDDQKRIWRAAIENAPRGLLRQLDAQMLSIWVVAASLHEEAREKVATFGMIVKSPQKGVPMQSPYLPIINRQAEIMLRSASELGFSPTSRARITVPGGGKREQNRFSNNAARKRA